MKRNHMFKIAALAIIGPGWGAFAALPMICLDGPICVKQANCTKYCCPTGKTGTRKVCPSGWQYSVFEDLCTRTDTSSGSDNTGKYEISYASCAAQQVTYPCYELSATATSGAASCMACAL